MTSRAKEAALVLIGFTVLAAAATYPLIRRLTTELAGDAGDPVLSAWVLAWDAGRIRNGLTGLWNAPNFFPYHNTLAYSDHLLGIAIFTAPIQWLTNNPVFTYNIAFLAAFVTSAAGIYVLARTLTGRRDAASIAALLYVLTPFRVAHIAHVQWLTIGWLPLSVWALHRYFDTHRWRFLATTAVCYLMQALTASYFAYFALVPLAIVGAAEAWRRPPPLARTVVHLAASAILVLAVLVPIGRGYYEARQEAGLRRLSTDIVRFSADVRDYASAPPRTWLWRRLVGAADSEHALFPGAMTLALAAIALVLARPRYTMAVYAVLALAAGGRSRGAPPALAGHRLPMPGPYGWLVAIVPGLDALRAAARLATIVVLALSVLAAFGAAWLLDRATLRYRSVAFVAIAAAIIIEGWAVPIPTASFDPRGPSLDRNVYQYLRESAPGAILELPIALGDAEREFSYQYLTLIHGHPIVNGHSGYLPPLFLFLGGGHSPFREVDNLGAAMAMLRAIGVRYLVLHTADDLLEMPAGRFLDHRDQIEAVRTFRRAAVITLREAPPVAGATSGHRIETSALRVRASHAPERLGLALDGNPETRWLSGTRQSGNEWIEVEFDRPTDVSVIEMQLASRSFGDYPRHLAVDLIDAAGTHTVFDRAVLPELAAGLIRNGTYPSIDVALAPNRARVIRLRQLGTTRSFFWSIHELRVWER